jgi:hypothetical protein
MNALMYVDAYGILATLKNTDFILEPVVIERGLIVDITHF